MTVRIRKLIACVLAVGASLAIGVAGTAQAAHHRHHHRHHTAHRSAIPQHNGGDHDADNNGGPSDGDGAI